MKIVYENRTWWNEEERQPGLYISKGLFRPFSIFPFITRELTLKIHPENASHIVVSGGKYLEKLFWIGNYLKKNTETYRLVFQSFYRTLKKSEVDADLKNIEKFLNEQKEKATL